MTSLMYLNVYNCFILCASIHPSHAHASKCSTTMMMLCSNIVYLLYLFECYPHFNVIISSNTYELSVVLSLEIFEFKVGLIGIAEQKNL